MKDKTKQVKKVCGFYVNDWHLTTMVLPYIRNEIQAKNEIVTIKSIILNSPTSFLPIILYTITIKKYNTNVLTINVIYILITYLIMIKLYFFIH